MPTRVTEEDRGKELVYRTNRVGTVTDISNGKVRLRDDILRA